MSVFRDMVQRDNNMIFMNPEEFGEPHIIDDEEMNIIIDGNELVEREKRYKTMSEGLHIRQLLIYVSAARFGPLPLIDRILELDGEYFIVKDAVEETGIYSISLEAKES